MKLYHGSNCDFTEVDLSKSKDRRDFGKGFYLTTLPNQAKDWAEILFDRYGGDGVFVYEFEFEITAKMAIKKLRGSKLNNQISIHSKKALNYLTLINKTAYGN